MYNNSNYPLITTFLNHSPNAKTVQIILSEVLLINQFTSGIIFFRSPRTGLFPVKIREKFLAINIFVVKETMSGQPNKCLIY